MKAAKQYTLCYGHTLILFYLQLYELALWLHVAYGSVTKLNWSLGNKFFCFYPRLLLKVLILEETASQKTFDRMDGRLLGLYDFKSIGSLPVF